jgi:hypothetical protein
VGKGHNGQKGDNGMKVWSFSVCIECKQIVKKPHIHQKLIRLKWTKSRGSRAFELSWDFDADPNLIDALDRIGQRFWRSGIRVTKVLIEEALRNL